MFHVATQELLLEQLAALLAEAMGQAGAQQQATIRCALQAHLCDWSLWVRFVQLPHAVAAAVAANSTAECSVLASGMCLALRACRMRIGSAGLHVPGLQSSATN